MRYKVTWTDIYSKNLNGRNYSPNCFEIDHLEGRR